MMKEGLGERKRVKFNPFSGSGAILRYKRRAYVNVSKSSLTLVSHLEVQGCNILPSSVKSPLYTSEEFQMLMTAKGPHAPKGQRGHRRLLASRRSVYSSVSHPVISFGH